MKKCTKCGIIKDFDEFSKSKKSKDGLQWYCKICSNSLAIKNYHENKERYFSHAKSRTSRLRENLIALKNKPCADCGQIYPSYVMDFDHVKSKGKKIANVAAMMRRRFAWEKIVQEIEKCELVCSNCHRIRTHHRLTETEQQEDY